MSGRTTLAALNGATVDKFVRALEGVFEHAPWVAQRVAGRRPFADVGALHAAMLDVVRQAPELPDFLNGHPELAADRLADDLTAESRAEQLGLGMAGAAGAAALPALNRAYRERFGFPFIICVARQTAANVLRRLRARLLHGTAQEMEAAIAEVGHITRLRLQQRVAGAVAIGGRVSCHVLDVTAGRPAAGLPVALLQEERQVAAAETDRDGRIGNLLPAGPVREGQYTLRFQAGAYFAERGTDTFYDVIPVGFVVAAAEGHYHVPLLLAPFGYSTYRGELMPDALWIRDPLAILADAPGGVVVEDGRITALLGAGERPPGPHAAFDAGEHVVLPGLINTHHHFYQTLTRAYPPALDRPLFPWLQALYPVWARLTPAALEAAVTVALAELLLSGCTTTTDHHYVFPAGLEHAIDIEAAAAARLGIRAVLTRGSMDLSQRDGGLPPDSVVQDRDTILADSARLIARFHDKAPHAMLQIALAPCSPFSVTTGLMRETAALAGREGVLLHTHLAETDDEAAFCQARFGCSPLDYLEACGWLRPGTWLAHGIHFGAAEIGRLAAAKVGVTHCPCSNQALASGTCPVCAMERAGVAVGLGVDGSASNDGSNLMQEVRAAFLLQRGANGIGAVSHRDALRWATEGSAACLRRPELGRIAVGAAADLALFRLDELRFSGAGDPVAALVLCGAHRADRVMVAGRWVVADGRVVGLDVGALRRRHADAAAALAV